MSKGRNITPEQRRLVQQLRKDGMSYRKISAKLEISVTACHQAIQHIKHHGTPDNVPRKARPRKTDQRTDRKIHRLSEADRFKTAVVIHGEISTDLHEEISIKTVQRRLDEFQLYGRVARKKPFISEKSSG
ncbi:uncharacterized protein LOC128884597 [Hylaeus volcanicus]|uniref:uncharacterized protein LOC128884597 n=1 Tax=Hylaeus volcanicus TaxID=313075 RepID=UPI0023B8549E|nr:uncharacterized protein LOC128884597 [Hylaeus volcanicus]